MGGLAEYPDGATPLDPDEMEGLKYAHVETRGELNQLEQQNIQQGLIWLSRQRGFKDLLTEEFVLELHRRLFGKVWSWAGSFRRSDKNVGPSHLAIGVELRNLLDDAKYWCNHETYGRIEFAARFHHRLVWVHPFPNGNGRHARIMTDAILEKVLEVPPAEWGPKDTENGGESRRTYIQALKAADRHDYQPLIGFLSH